jgi:hypothetical protein
MTRPTQPHQKDPDATITALRIVRAQMATPDGETSSFDIRVTSAMNVIGALASLAVAGFRKSAELDGCMTEDKIRSWAMTRLDEIIEDVTLQALGSQDPGQ